VNPPLRTDADIRAIIEGIVDGTIDVLGTDHAPHSASEKAADFSSAPFGVIGLECALPLYAKALVESGAIGWERLIALLTLGPARLLGIDCAGFGQLRVGGPADITVIDPSAKWTINARAFESRSRNCPFNGWQVRGRATDVIVGGRWVLRSGVLAGRGPSNSEMAAHGL
jgi:dihydroorotase